MQSLPIANILLVRIGLLSMYYYCVRFPGSITRIETALRCVLKGIIDGKQLIGTASNAWQKCCFRIIMDMKS